MLDGYETKTVIQPINAPWWDNYLTEFFTENMIPVSMRDEREYTYKLEPAQSPPQGELRDRAEALRQRGTGAAQAAARGHPGMARLLMNPEVVMNTQQIGRADRDGS